MTEYDRKTYPCRNEAAMRYGILALLTTVLLGACTSPSTPDNRVSDGVTKVPITTETNILAGQWRYMPGVEVTETGLLIKHTGFAIVEQDGAAGQANPPVNEIGTHAQVAGDFVVDATVRDATGPAELQLYGEPPTVQDEFRMPAESVRLSVDTEKGQLGITEWGGTSPTPVEAQTFAFESTGAPNIAVKHSAGTLTFSVNNKVLGTLPEHGIFGSREVWFGADAPQKNSQWFLSKLGMRGINGSAVDTVDTSSFKIDQSEATGGLQELASKKRFGFLLGAAMAAKPLAADPAYAKTAFENFGSMTTENALKWQFTEPQPGQYTFQEGDALVKVATQNNVVIHGHALVWAEANPRWVTAMPTGTIEQKAAVENVMADHVKTEAGHYGDKIASWDVVNEPLDDDGKLRDSVWLRAMGEQYMDKAFAAAHAASPKAKLFMNMYGAEAPGPIRDSYVALAKRLLSRGVPLDGVGLQMHVYESGDKVSSAELTKTINMFKALGLRVRISEIDVYSDDGQAVQAQQYASALDSCIENDACVSYTTWGVSDRYDFWKDDDGSIKQGQDFLWDANMSPTPAVAALQRVLTER